VEFVQRAAQRPKRLGFLPGTFNPPTRAHVALAEAALAFVDEVLLVIPTVLPHKSYDGVGLQDRMKMLERVVLVNPRFSLAFSERGLFLDIARECRQAYGPGIALALICGKDAAERALRWKYDHAGAVPEMLTEFWLLVADRGGTFEPPAGAEDRVVAFSIADEYEDISASLIRERIRKAEPWEHLVPPEIVSMVRELYSR
jgi:nicotinate (nicotinamide) nucleotide adenylyltransferase